MDSPLELLDQLRDGRLLVFGDSMLDRYVWGDVERISPEAPVPVLRADLEEVRLGGAASVAMLAKGLGAKVSLCSVVSDDSPGRTITRLLDEAGIDHSGLITDPERPTTEKLRFLGRAQGRHTQQLFRVDRESCRPARSFVEEHLAEMLADQILRHDAVLVSDYAKGVCSEKLLAHLIKISEEAGVPVLVDPACISDYSRYAGAYCLLPNRSEAEAATGHSIRDEKSAKSAGEALASRFNAVNVLVKLDQDGLLLWEKERESHLIFSARTRQVYDVTGAGDMVLAMMGLAIACQLSTIDAAMLANVAAGLEVEKLGVAVVSREDIRCELARTDHRAGSKVIQRDRLQTVVAIARRSGQSIVFTNGCFDLLHPGHVAYLEQAAALGDLLVVGVNSDRSIQDLKGMSRPIIDEDGRAQMLAALACVDYVCIFDEPTPHALLESICPEVLVKGGTYTEQEVVGREIVEAYGGHVCVVGSLPGVSTTQLIKRITAVKPVSDETPPMPTIFGPPKDATFPTTFPRGAPDCVHRGAMTGAVRCPSCKLPTKVHVYRCALFEYCTIPKVTEQYHACHGCESRTTAIPGSFEHADAPPVQKL